NPSGRRPAPDVSRRAAAGVITFCDHRSPGTSPCEGFFEKLLLLPLAETVVQIGEGAAHHKAGSHTKGDARLAEQVCKNCRERVTKKPEGYQVQRQDLIHRPGCSDHTVQYEVDPQERVEKCDATQVVHTERCCVALLDEEFDRLLGEAN